MLSESYGGNGVVIAPEQKDDPTLWDEITVALVAPPPRDDAPGLGLNGVIEQAAKGMRDAGQNFQTLQRQERTVDAKPAQVLKAEYREKSSGREWIEELIFIEGPDNEIYSIALKCAPGHEARLEPILTEVVRTWTLPVPEPPAAEADPPEQAAPPAKTPTIPPQAQ